jgi:hypothetical protein
VSHVTRRALRTHARSQRPGTVVCLVAWRVVLQRRQPLGQQYRGTRNNVPSRIAFPMRKSAAGAFRKGRVPPPHPPWMRSAPQALDSHPPRSMCSTRRADRLVPGCGRRSQAPSVIPRLARPNGPASHVVVAWVERQPPVTGPTNHRPGSTSDTGPLATDDRGMTGGACERRPHPGTC